MEGIEKSQQDSFDNSFTEKRYKIIFIGDNCVGKTAIISRIERNEFYDEITIGIDFVTKIIKYRGQNIKIQLWDTTGQEKYKGLIPSYIRNTSIAFVVYDVSYKNSFNNVPSWINLIKSIANPKIVLCGNKIDLTTREVEKREGEEYAKKEGFQFFEVSALTNENIKLMFYSAIADLPSLFEGEINKESLIKELLEENEVGNNQMENNIQISAPEKENTININGKKVVTKFKKRRCQC